jgi:hypothetical protein
MSKWLFGYYSLILHHFYHIQLHFQTILYQVQRINSIVEKVDAISAEMPS